ncbi:MAG TPA: hypothetical protein PJ988_20245, partial [Anaerolinea sp.]|nr:hypothetical protein [Anaerolinea sp.]
ARSTVRGAFLTTSLKGGGKHIEFECDRFHLPAGNDREKLFKRRGACTAGRSHPQGSEVDYSIEENRYEN